MNVLSLFDGMSCGRIALERLGVKVDNYYASEIDKYAIKVSQANYPDIIQVGDICNLNPEDFKDIDLILAGSPCQGFSFAGKQLAFDDPRSALFFEFIRLLKAIKPKYFLLENVRMKKEFLDVISKYMGVTPIFINSALVSAQSRQRYYWTNIPNITQPEERGIVLRDILEENPRENPVKDTARNQRHYKNLDEKSLCMTATMYKGAGNNGMTLVPQKLLDDNLPKMTTKDEKAYCLTASYSAAEPVNSIERKQRTMIPVEEGQELPEDISLVYDNEGKSHKPQHIGTAVDVNGPDILKRVYSPDGKSPTLNTCGGGNTHAKVVCGAWRGRYNQDGSTSQKLELRKDNKTNSITTVQKDNVLTKDEVYWRKLTPLECERLQTVPDNYTNHVSNTQRYKMLGNGWTIEVIAHILKNMEVED